MRYILILLLLVGTAYGQFAPTSAKTAFKNGISLGTRDSTAYNSSDSLAVVINRQGRMMYRSTDGFWKLLANVGTGDFVPYTGATQNVTIGNFRVSARTLLGDSIMARGSGGVSVYSNSGTHVALFGAGGGSGTTLYGGLNGTTGTFSGDLSVGGKATIGSARILSTSPTLLNLFIGDSAGNVGVAGIENVGLGYRALASITGAAFPSGSFNTAVGSWSLQAVTTGNKNAAYGRATLESLTTGIENTAIGYGSSHLMTTSNFNTALGFETLHENITGSSNTALGYRSLFNAKGDNNTAVGLQSGQAITTGSFNTLIGINAGLGLTTTGSNTALGYNAGVNANGSSNILIGAAADAASGVSASTVIGNAITAKTSNTVVLGSGQDVVIGRDSARGFKLDVNGSIRGTTVSIDGGTSTQFLMADGSTNSTAFGTGSVTSVATNNGSGIIGGPITTGGTLELDTTNTVSTKLNVVKVVNSTVAGYLPLTGGALTGALNGTSASFSSFGRFDSTLLVNNLTAATNTTTGAFVVTGGVGVGGSMYVGGNFVTNDILMRNATSLNFYNQGGTLLGSFAHSTGKFSALYNAEITGSTTTAKIIGNSSTPSISGGSATYIGTGASTSVVGNDMAGIATLVTGTGCGSTGASNRNAFAVTFASAYSTAPVVIISAIQKGGLVSTDGPTNQTFFLRSDAVSTTGFTVYLPIGTTLTDSTTYEITYHVIGK